MISAELAHNPYLLTTTIRFNGCEPKVNSAVEKFEGQPLVSWVQEVPRIFHDEMNGYDFDLLFKGTNSDFLKLTESFQSQGIGNDLVRIVHTGEYEDVSTKRREIANLLTWLDENRNSRFDHAAFIESNPDLLDPSDPYIIVQEEPLQLDLPYAQIEAVKTISELKGMLLTEVPILLTVNRRNRALIRSELSNVLKRPDVEREQLFFYIHPTLDTEQVIRVISDLGVKDPQIITKPDDNCVVEYLNNYPATTYVRKAIAAFRQNVDETSKVLEKVYSLSEATSASNKRDIEEIEAQINKLRDVHSRMHVEETSVYLRQYTDEIYNDLCKSLEARILAWRNRRKSVSGIDQILEAAKDYAADVQKLLQPFETNLFEQAEFEKVQVEQFFKALYEEAEPIPIFIPVVSPPQYPSGIDLPVIEHRLIGMTETTVTAARNDFFGLFGVQVENREEANTTEVANYETWRSEVLKIVMPLAFGLVKSYKEALGIYYKSVAKAYREQLSSVISQRIKAKEEETSKLSARERKLQEDADWLDEFETQLLRIERS